jgi:2-oxoglutarate dehydrogenase E1 component
LQERLESIRSTPNFTADKKKHILERLTAAEGLERYLHTKYVGQKRFSLEGGETFIASIDETIQRAGEKGVQEIVIGMAHRGRLNVLVNTLGKAPQGTVRRIRRQARRRPAGRRRQVPPRFLVRHLDPGRSGTPVAGVQPVAPGNRQPCR